MRCNCLVYALRKWFTHGGYVVMRRSRYGWWPHFLWSPDLLQFFAFVPVKRPHRRWLPPLWFKGSERKGR
jgi:hypothetical protein